MAVSRPSLMAPVRAAWSSKGETWYKIRIVAAAPVEAEDAMEPDRGRVAVAAVRATVGAEVVAVRASAASPT